MTDAYETTIAQQIDAARPAEFAPLQLGPLSLWPPVLLAPMAGVTNIAFRELCRRFGAPLCESEMIAARPLVDDNARTWELAAFGADEHPRSMQLYAVEPAYVGRAIERLTAESHVEHIDLNFGCSVPKVTRQGGGAALPHRPKLLESILTSAARAAGRVPLTVKFRLGLTSARLNYLETGRIAEQCGCSAVTLHARTAEQFYEGQADWNAIGQLKRHVSIPVIGNGDVWEAADAIRMMRSTGCDGVAIGRGCLGRPWLFDDVARMFNGHRPNRPPSFGRVVDLMREHLLMLIDSVGEERALPSFRRQATWYTKGFRGSTQLREAIVTVNTFAEFDAILSKVDRDLEFPLSVLRVPRAKSSSQKALSLPHGYLDDPEAAALPTDGICADGG
ncbi:MAG TPA: tRNA dihydrouridine synthase DusB [Polyangiaceae bacterium]